MAADYLCHDCGRTWSGCPRFTADGPLDLIFFEKEGFAPKLNYYVFPKLQTHEKRPQITLMLASQALRSCSRLEHALAYRSRSSSHNLSRYVLPTRACRSRPSLSANADLLRKPFGFASQRLAQPLSRLRRLSGLAQGSSKLSPFAAALELPGQTPFS